MAPRVYFLLFLCCLYTPPGVHAAPPTNANCSNAIAITGNTTTGTTVEAPGQSGCATQYYGSLYSVYYTYTASSSNSDIAISINNGHRVGIQSGTCASLQCRMILEPSGTFKNRKAGVYIISAFTSSPSTFTLTLLETPTTPQPPEQCTGAVVLSNGVPYSANMTGFSELQDSCQSTLSFVAAYWFSYTTVGTNNTVKISTCATSYYVTSIRILEGNNCSVTTCKTAPEEVCFAGPGSFVRTDPLPQGYLLLFYVTITSTVDGGGDQLGDFVVEVTEETPVTQVPVNADCGAAIPLASSGIYNGSSLGSATTYNYWYGTYVPDPVYFVYTPTFNSSLVTVSTCGGQTDYRPTLEAQTSCTSSSPFEDSDGDCLGNLASSLTFVAGAGAPTYISMSGGNGGMGYYSVITSEQELPTVTNTRCQTAVALTSGTSQTLYYYGTPVSALCGYSSQRIVYFTYVTQTSSSTLVISASTDYRGSPTTYLFVAPQTQPPCQTLSCAKIVNANGPNFATLDTGTVGTQYVIGFSAQDAEIDNQVTIKVEEKTFATPSNVNCQSAATLTKGVTVVGNTYRGTNMLACNNSVYVPPVPALFYKYTVTQNNAILQFQKAYISGADSTYLVVTWSTACVTAGGKQNFGTCGTTDMAQPAGPYNAGQLVYIAVRNPQYGIKGLEFNFTVTEMLAPAAPTNLNCASAKTLTAGNPLETSTYLSTSTSVGGQPINTFYKYTTTMANSYLNVESCRLDSAGTSNSRFWYQLLSDCSGYVSLSGLSGCFSRVVLNNGSSGTPFVFGVGTSQSPVRDALDQIRITVEEKPQGTPLVNSACNMSQPIGNGTHIEATTVGIPVNPSPTGDQRMMAYYSYTTTISSSMLVIDGCKNGTQYYNINLFSACSTTDRVWKSSSEKCPQITYFTRSPANTTFYIGVDSFQLPTDFLLDVKEFASVSNDNYLCDRPIQLSNWATFTDNTDIPREIVPQAICRSFSYRAKYFKYTTLGGTGISIIFSAGISSRNGVYSGAVVVRQGSCLLSNCVDLITPPNNQAAPENQYRFTVIPTFASGTDLIIIVSWESGRFDITVEESGAPSPSSTPTPSASSSVTLTPSPSASVSLTSSASSTLSATPTPTSSDSSSVTPTSSASSSVTASSSSSVTTTPSSSVTPTPTSTSSDSSTRTPTVTPTPSSSISTTSSASTTPTATSSHTSSDSPTSSASVTQSSSSSQTGTPSSSVTPTPSSSVTPTPTPSVTPTGSDSITPTPSSSVTPTGTPTPSSSVTPTSSLTPTPTSTSSDSPTSSASITTSSSSSGTPTPSTTSSDSPSSSPSVTTTPSSSGTPTPTSTSSDSSSSSPSITTSSSSSVTPTPSTTSSDSPSVTTTPSSSGTPTPSTTTSDSPSSSASITTSSSSSVTPTPTSTSSDSPSSSPSVTATPSSSVTPTPTSTSSDTASSSPSITASSSASVTTTPSITTSDSPTGSASITTSSSWSGTPSSSPSVTMTPSASGTSTPSITTSDSSTITASPSSSETMTPSSTSSDSSTASITRSLAPSVAPAASPTPSTSSSVLVSVSGTPSLTLVPSVSGTPSASTTPSLSVGITPSSSLSLSSSHSASMSVSETPSLSQGTSPSATLSVSVEASMTASASGTISNSMSGTILRLPNTTATATPRNPEFLAPPAPVPSLNPSASSRASSEPSSSAAAANNGGNTGGTGGTGTSEPSTTTSLTVTNGATVQVALDLSAGTNTLDIATESGEKSVSVSIPSSVIAGLPPGTTINAKFVDVSTAATEVSGSGFSLGSSVIDLTFSDASGGALDFSGDIELCFQVTAAEANVQGSCLGFLNEESGQWECQDDALKDNGSGEFCGTTPHFTSFALLLGASCGPEDECSSGQGQVIQWLSLGFGCGAVAMVMIGVVMVEVSVRRRRRKLTREMRRVKNLTDSLATSRSM